MENFFGELVKFDLSPHLTKSLVCVWKWTKYFNISLINCFFFFTWPLILLLDQIHWHELTLQSEVIRNRMKIWWFMCNIMVAFLSLWDKRRISLIHGYTSLTLANLIISRNLLLMKNLFLSSSGGTKTD